MAVDAATVLARDEYDDIYLLYSSNVEE